MRMDRGRLNPPRGPILLAKDESRRSHPLARRTSQGGGYVLKKALERVTPDAEADHAGCVVDVFDRIGRYNAAATGEESRADSERIRHVGGGAVHRALDPSDDATLVVGDEKPVQP